MIPVEEADRSEEAVLRRHRVMRNDAEHGAANGEADVPDRDGNDEEDHGGDQPDGEDESFEEEPESPRSRYQRYLRSTVEEVSDVGDWANIHYGFARESDDLPEVNDHGIPTSRSRSRGSDNEPQPKTICQNL